MRDELIKAVTEHQAAFGIELPDQTIARLADYYELVQDANPVLHLVGPCSPREFAIRHILESLSLLEHLPEKVEFADVGTGAGLPSLPCLLVRKDLRAKLIESKEKKAAFLSDTINALAIKERTRILNHQFTETRPENCEVVTCRALDKFADKLPHLIRWAARRKLVLFGGGNLGDRLTSLKIPFDRKLIPMSEQRFLFLVSPKSNARA